MPERSAYPSHEAWLRALLTASLQQSEEVQDVFGHGGGEEEQGGSSSQPPQPPRPDGEDDEDGTGNDNNPGEQPPGEE